MCVLDGKIYALGGSDELYGADFTAMEVYDPTQDTWTSKASMLHGRYRIALHWPELSMGTFSKIMSTPGNVEDYMKALTK